MSALGNIMKKEIRELLTPATILPIIFMAIIFGSMGNFISGIEEEISEPPIIGVIKEDNDTLAAIATDVLYNNSRVIYNATDRIDKEQGLEYLKQNEGMALIIIPENFTKNIYNGTQSEIEIYWIMKGAGVFDSISSAALENLLTIISTNISYKLLEENNTINATVALSPTISNQTTYFKDRTFKGLSPSELSGMMNQQSFIIPLVMMMIIIMAGSLVINSMAFEKENKTLETLLTLPVRRFTIVTGKIASAAVIGLLLSVIYMIGISYYFQSLQTIAGLNLANYNIALTAGDFLLIGVSLFITLVAALSLCMLLGTFAKNYKSAQTLIFPIVLLALLPMILTMFMDFDTMPIALKGLLFAIPFSHPMMAPRALLFNEYLLVIGGIIYVSIFALVIMLIVVWIFKTDKILTGSIRIKMMKGKKYFFKLKKQK
jgi:ABC-2 type transport system permease protein